MSVRMALLAILGQQPCYGYQLKAEFEHRTGSLWPLNVGQVYSTLDRLLRDGLVVRLPAASDGQIYFEVTDAGRAETVGWFRAPVVTASRSRDELTIKLALAVTLEGVDAANVIDVQKRETAASLRVLDGARGSARASTDIARELVVDALALAAEAEIRWLDHVESTLASATEAGASLRLPVSSAARKRGRPTKAHI